MQGILSEADEALAPSNARKYDGDNNYQKCVDIKVCVIGNDDGDPVFVLEAVSPRSAVNDLAMTSDWTTNDRAEAVVFLRALADKIEISTRPAKRAKKKKAKRAVRGQRRKPAKAKLFKIGDLVRCNATFIPAHPNLMRVVDCGSQLDGDGVPIVQCRIIGVPGGRYLSTVVYSQGRLERAPSV